MYCMKKCAFTAGHHAECGLNEMTVIYCRYPQSPYTLDIVVHWYIAGSYENDHISTLLWQQYNCKPVVIG
jgi:hypothetical protein